MDHVGAVTWHMPFVEAVDFRGGVRLDHPARSCFNVLKYATSRDTFAKGEESVVLHLAEAVACYAKENLHQEDLQAKEVDRFGRREYGSSWLSAVRRESHFRAVLLGVSAHLA